MLADRAQVVPGSVQQDTGIHPAEWAAYVRKKENIPVRSPCHHRPLILQHTQKKIIKPDRPTSKLETEVQTNRQTDRWADSQTDRQTERQIDRQTDRRTDTLTDGHTD